MELRGRNSQPIWPAISNPTQITVFFYMPQICDMRQTALLPLRRKACRSFFRPGSNPRSWVPEASMLTARPPKSLLWAPAKNTNILGCDAVKSDLWRTCYLDLQGRWIMSHRLSWTLGRSRVTWTAQTVCSCVHARVAGAILRGEVHVGCGLLLR
jgi:hypothetical protein